MFTLFHQADDSKQDYRHRILRYVIIIAIISSSIWLMARLVFSVDSTELTAYALAAILGLSLVMLGFHEYGYTHVVRVVFPFGLWMFVTTTAWSTGGVESVSYTGYIVFIILFTFVLGERVILAFMVCSLIAGLMMTLTGQSTSEMVYIWLIRSLFIAVATFTQLFLLRYVYSLLDELQTRNNQLEQEAAARAQLKAIAAHTERRYQKLFETAPVGIFTKDRDGYYTSTNDRHGMFGELKNQKFTDADLQPPQLAAIIQANDRYVIEKDEEMVFEERLVLNSEVNTFMCHKSPLHDEQGHVIGLIGVSINITEQRRLQEEINRLYELSVDMMCVVDQQGRFVRVNPAFERILGYTPEEMLGKPGTHFIHEDDVQATIDIFVPVLAGQPLSAFENRYLTKDDAARWFSWYMIPSEGFIYCIARDVTETKELDEIRARNEEILIANNDQLRREVMERKRAEDERDRLFRVALDIMCILNAEGQFERVNPAFERILGYTSDEVIDYKLEDFTHPADRDDKLADLNALSEDKKPMVNAARRYLTKDGAERWLSWTIVAAAGRFYCVARDITELIDAIERTQQANEQLTLEIIRREQAQDELAQFYNLSLDMICVADDTGYFRRVNPAFTTTLGYSEEELLSRPLMDFIHPEDVEITLSATKNLDQGKSLSGFRNRYITASGEVKWLEWTAIPMGNVHYAVGRDVTQNLRVEEMKRELQVQETVMRLKQNFVSHVSHEVRTPLTVILSSNEILRRYYDRLDETKRLNHLEKIEQQTHHMISMIDDLLLIDKLGNSQLDLEVAEIDFIAFAQQIVDDLRGMVRDNQTLTLTHSATRERIMIDQRLMRHILINLLTNAIKYSPDGGQITLDICIDDADVTITVADEGMGIQDKDQRHIFEPFNRSRDHQEIQGTGLGLTIAKNSVEKHGGSINVESTLGQGSVFTVFIPLDIHE